MDNKEKLKSLIRQGKEIGYILNSDLDSCLIDYSSADKLYISETIDGMEIQLIDSAEEYDEYKYLSGEEAIKILKSLSDGNHEAFTNPQDKDKGS